MDLKEFLTITNSGQTIEAMSEALFFSDSVTQRALKLTSELNCSFHTQQEVRSILSELIMKPVPEHTFINPPFYTDFGCNITIGDGCYVNIGCTMQDHGGIVIGDGCQIGHHVTIVTVNHGQEPENRGNLHPEPVHIGKGVWIGANSTILPGISIGDYAIIGAGSVVTHDVPAYTVAAGNPARLIRKIDPAKAGQI
ncbi:MAG: sugar O-acetyltransferase [Eubacteriales bacterium]|nr:sugar O-acetyltransferase [Eubacteriales bacterium]